MSTANGGPLAVKPVTPDLPPVVYELAGDPVYGGGVGGWETLDRPRAEPALVWASTPGATLGLPVILDGLDAGGVGIDTIVEPAIAATTALGRPHPATGQPPLLAVHGLATVPTSVLWVLQGIEWGAVLADEATGARVQQELVLQLARYIEPTLVPGPAAASQARTGSSGGFTLTYITGSKKAGKNGKQKPKKAGKK